MLVCDEPPLLDDVELVVCVVAVLDPFCPDVVDAFVDVPVWAVPPDWPVVDDPELPVVADAEPDEPVVEAPV